MTATNYQRVKLDPNLFPEILLISWWGGDEDIQMAWDWIVLLPGISKWLVIFSFQYLILIPVVIRIIIVLGTSSVQLSCSVVSNSLRPHELQHTRPPCLSPNPGVHSDSRPLSQWCHPAISSSVIPFSSCPQSLPASESFPMSQLFTWGGQSTGASALASFPPKNTQGWSPSEWTGWISLQSKVLSGVFSNTTVQKHKTKIMASGPISSWEIVGETVETVSDFIWGRSKITADGDCSHEIKRCLLLGRNHLPASGGPGSIWGWG